MAGRHAGNRTIPEAYMAAALIKADGIVADAAKALKCTPQAIHDRLRNTPGLQKTMADAEAHVIDLSKRVVTRKIRDKDCDRNARWYLEHRSKEFSNKNDMGLSEDALHAIVAAFGGDVDRLKAARAAIEQPAPLLIEAQANPASPAEK